MKTIVNSSASTGSMSAHFKLQCSSCEGHVKSVRREFSDQAWAALVAWSEICSKAVDEAICNDCYHNFRDVLIDRADEMRLVSLNTLSTHAAQGKAMAALA